MVLMTAGSELDPVFGMPLATMAKCVKAAQDEQRDIARPWTVGKGPAGTAVATLVRLQWTILEHESFLGCMHDGRVVDPRRVCPYSMRILLKQAAQAWQ